MTFAQSMLKAAAARPGRLVLPETDDPRMRDAATEIAAQGIGTVIGSEEVAAADTEALAEAVIAARPQAKPAIVRRMMAKPLIRAAAMVSAGMGDALIAGAATPTRRVIEAAGLAIGMEPGIEVPSSFFIMLPPDRPPVIFADCALNVAPTAAELAGIGIATAGSAARLLDDTPRTAFLSFSTGTSGTGTEVDKVRQAVDLARSAAPALVLDGPLQADAALSPAIAQTKGADGAVGGQANVLVFPTLDAGNIAYKLTQELGRAQAVGPFLQGFARPVCDLSRGASVDDIVLAAAVMSALA